MSSLRFLRPDDLPLLARALRALAPPHEAAHHHDVATLRQWMNVYGTRPGNCMVLWEKDELHGVLLSARRQTLTGEVQGLVQEIFIHPAHRRRGHGAEMLADLQKKVAIMGMKRLFLEVPDEPGARAFAAAVGFEMVEWPGEGEEHIQTMSGLTAKGGNIRGQRPGMAVPAAGEAWPELAQNDSSRKKPLSKPPFLEGAEPCGVVRQFSRMKTPNQTDKQGRLSSPCYPEEPIAQAKSEFTPGQGVDFSFSLPVAEEDGPVAGYAWGPLEPGLLPPGDHWYTGVTAFAREGAVTGLWTTPTGCFALLGEEDTLLAMVALGPQATLSSQDLLALSQHFLWVQAKNWPPDHPLLALIPPQAAPRWRRSMAVSRV